MATVRPDPAFDAEKAAERLRKAMKGMGTNEKEIISVLSSCSNAQRQEIKIKFKQMYGKDLIDDLKSELGGKLEDVVLALMRPAPENDAHSLHKAMAGMGTNEEVLIEIMCSRTASEILAIREAYQALYHKDLEEALVSETGGRLKRILRSLVQGARPEDTNVDLAKAQSDARALFEAGEGQWGTDESEFNRVFMTCSNAQIRAVCDEYLKISSYDLVKAVKKEMSGDLEDAFVALVECARDTAGYFAERLYRSMHGAGTDDATLIRCVVARCEVDMERIKEIYVTRYGKSLAKHIKSDCSGDYERVLLALIGE